MTSRPSLYAQYVKERTDRQIIEDSRGFATFVVQQDYVYIEDIYVLPEYRNSKVGQQYEQQIAEYAKSLGLNKLVGSVCITAKNASESAAVLLHIGYKITYVADNMIYFTKKLDVENGTKN